MLEHTTSRILQGLNNLTDDVKLILTCKWGCDGASGQPRYKQILHTKQNTENIDDETVFISSLVLIKLHNKLTSEIVWENPRPSSPWFCRPIQFKFVKETQKVIEQEVNKINRKIQHLKPTKINNTHVEYITAFTMC